MTENSELDYPADTALTNSDLHKYLLASLSRRLVTFIDACYAADTVLNQRALVDIAEMARSFTGAGRVTIASAGGGQESIEAQDLRQGIFTYFLAQSMRGQADQPPCGNCEPSSRSTKSGTT
ncbi:MAG: hypothetical protein IT442_09860 [Phycisphaeraceae bacterium]|nr:hypothetical protein [Phycisphaeraceae bacterium]